MKNILKELCLDLQASETTEDAINVLKKAGYWDSGDFWHPYGDNPPMLLSFKINLIVHDHWLKNLPMFKIKC